MFQIASPTFSTCSLPAGNLVLIGRGTCCDIQLSDRSASRVHCRLLSRDGKVFLTDASSRWGTFVNRKRVQEAELTVRDEFTIGETVLRLTAESDARGTTLVPPKYHAGVIEWKHFKSEARMKQPPVYPTFPPTSSNSFVAASYLHKRFLRYKPKRPGGQHQNRHDLSHGRYRPDSVTSGSLLIPFPSTRTSDTPRCSGNSWFATLIKADFI